MSVTLMNYLRLEIPQLSGGLSSPPHFDGGGVCKGGTMRTPYTVSVP